MDSNLYGAFPVKWWFLVFAGSSFGAGKPFFVPSPAIRFAERAEGVKGSNTAVKDGLNPPTRKGAPRKKSAPTRNPRCASKRPLDVPEGRDCGTCFGRPCCTGQQPRGV